MTPWHLFCALHLGELTVLGPKCHSADCLEPVAARVHWVTGPLDVCATCAERFRRVASSFAMVLRVEPVEYTPAGLDDAELRFRLMELS